MTRVESSSSCALVLAGRRTVGAPDPVAASAAKPVKALVSLNGRTMIERVLWALRESSCVDEIYVCLPDDVDLEAESPVLAAEFASGRLKRVTPLESPSASVRGFVEKHVSDQDVLVTTADHPLLTPDMIRKFMGELKAAGVDAGVGLASVEQISAAYPGAHRTSLHFADGRFTGCNLFAFRGKGALDLLAFWRRIDQHRKRPWRLARALGFDTLLLYLLNRLSLAGAMKRLSLKSGARLHAVRMSDLHAGIDVDTLQDVELVSQILRQREGANK